MPALSSAFLDRPITHRALHGPGRPENSRAAIRAAVEAGYGIEIDLQLSADGQAMVFHDYELERLTGVPGLVRDHSSSELARIPLLGDTEGIPTLNEVLAIVDGKVPLLIEIKDQSGNMGERAGALATATAKPLFERRYPGSVAVMSFNPEEMFEWQRWTDDPYFSSIPVGLTTCAFDSPESQKLPPAVRQRLIKIEDFDRVGADFISHDWRDLESTRVAELKTQGVPILCWTIRSPQEEAIARRVADNVTFEGYLA